MSDINPKRKCKGGAEKVRDKKLKILGKDGAKCRNLVDLFKATPIQTKDTSSQQTPSASKQPDTNRNEHWDDQVVDKSEELRKCKFCKKCPVCCFSVLHKYSFYGQTYKHLFSAYKLLLTLSSTQVACERSFSKLKYIKNRLRSSLSSTHHEVFMLMSTETDVLSELNNDTIIDHVAEMAPGLKKLLIL